MVEFFDYVDGELDVGFVFVVGGYLKELGEIYCVVD